MAYLISKSYNRWIDPLRLFDCLKEKRYPFFLDSSADKNAMGRYSFLGADPFMLISAKNEDVFARLREFLSVYALKPQRSAFPFWGGAVGYCSYDAGFPLEKKLVKKTADDLCIPDAVFGLYNTVFIFDHLKRRVSIACVGFPETRSRPAVLLCRENCAQAEAILKAADKSSPVSGMRRGGLNPPAKLTSTFTRRAYMAAVGKALQYIAAGDIYQVNLSQRFSVRTPLSAFEAYGRLRRIIPSCFGAYFDAGDFRILSASPERFLQLRGRTVTTRPMKGTRRRGRSKVQDARLRRQLLESAKDRAELAMIVDLERNDLGKVCRYGSVKVTSMRKLEKYSTVYQTTANVTGELRADKNALDAASACFPGGSITGCPKIRSMEIIEELEPVRRGVYTGCLGYIGFSGDMDLNILIRTALQKDNTFYFGVGGGIVADSIPEAEYEETLVKAAGFFQALEV